MDVLDDLTRDLFGAIVQIRRLDPAALPEPQLLHQRLCGFIDTAIARARERHVPAEDIGDVIYAIAALADEVVLGLPGSVQQFWMYNLLQLRYFNENVAGENFFHRLNALRQDPRRYPVLRIYYLCLLFGFQGRYRVRGGEVELAQIIEAVQADLVRFRVIEEETLSPHGRRPAEPGVGVRRSLPVLWLSAAAILTAVGINVALHVSLDSGVRDVKERIAALKGR